MSTSYQRLPRRIPDMPPYVPFHYSAPNTPLSSSDGSLDDGYSNPIEYRRRKGFKHLTQSDVLPDFEKKLNLSSPSIPGKSPSFALQDGLAFINFAAQAIAQDEFSKCFTQKPRRKFDPTTLLLTPLYWIGWFVRYFILFPYRLALLLVATVLFFLSLPIVLHIKSEYWQHWLFKSYCKAFLMSWGSRIRYHGPKPRVDEPHIFVSNHTSVIDYIVLSAHDFPHATVAQKHGGVIGYFENSVLTLNGSLMFDRNEKNDRNTLARKMREHVHNTKNVPLLIFPEGTCVNNEYTVLFHKGAFDLDAMVAPVAVRYNKKWADAYWHSKTQSFTKHLLYLMTRWALVADVWYLPPRARKPGQSAVEFANEVKAEISAVANLKNLSWDGYFKNFAPAKDKQVKLQQHSQSRYGNVLMNRMRNRPAADRMGHLRRSQSISISPAASGSSRDIAYAKPDWMDVKEATAEKNKILAALDDQRSLEMIEEISHRKNDVVKTWKRYTKMRSEDFTQRRIENSSWRLWFKQRIEQEHIKKRRLSDPILEQGQEESMSLAYNLMSYFPASLFSPPVNGRPRSRSLGTQAKRPSSSDYGFPTVATDPTRRSSKKYI